MNQTPLPELSPPFETTEKLRFGEVNTVLLLAPMNDEREQEACLHLSTMTPPAETAMIWVTYVEGVDDRLAGWLDKVSNLPASSFVIVVAGGDHEVSVTDPSRVRVKQVDDGSDLIRVGITINTIIDELNPDQHPVMCFHSLTVLLQYAEFKQIFHFLHALRNLFEEADAISHYHLDPNVVDDEKIAILQELCDAVVEVTPSGNIRQPQETTRKTFDSTPIKEEFRELGYLG